ncbi:rSAM-modified peptide [Flavobacterium cupreum]|uniref:rSAM-modified peptide n=1 Tax=Flavobacterium cupreum TaxID=2133766 RepID=UPI0018754FA5|nr:rSAM-modified peptide [Flavobacterium cupreum]
MESKKLTFEDFKAEKITRNQQKMVRGGDGTTGGEDPTGEDPIDGKDPIRGGGGTGNGNGNG